MGLYGIIFAIPIFVQEFLHFTAMQSGILQLPSAVAAAFAMILMGKISGRIDARLLIGTGALITVAAALWLAQINPDSSAGSLFWPLFLRGLGSVCMFLPLSLATLGDLPKDKVASGAGFYNLTRQLGSSIGIAVITTVLAYREAVHRSVARGPRGAGSPGAPPAPRHAPGCLLPRQLRPDGGPPAGPQAPRHGGRRPVDAPIVSPTSSCTWRSRSWPRSRSCSCLARARTRPPSPPPTKPSPLSLPMTSHATPLPAQRPKKGLRPAARIAIAIGIAAALVWLAHFAYDAFVYEETDDAFVAGHVHQVSAQIDGTVTAVLASDNQTVKAGDVLVKLDPLEFQLAVEKNQAGASRPRPRRRRRRPPPSKRRPSFPGPSPGRAGRGPGHPGPRSSATCARLNRTRPAGFPRGRRGRPGRSRQCRERLRRSPGRADRAEADVRVVQASVSSAQAAMKCVAGPGPGGQGLVPHLGGRRSRMGAGSSATRPWSLRPTAGWRNRNVEAGNRVRRGQVLFALVEPHLWIIANFEETQLGADSRRLADRGHGRRPARPHPPRRG